MSIKKNRLSDSYRESSLESTVCIVRNYDNSPIVLYVEEKDENTVIVKPVAGYYNRPLCVPKTIVFRFDPELLSRLEKPYSDGSITELLRLWRKAVAWTSNMQVV